MHNALLRRAWHNRTMPRRSSTGAKTKTPKRTGTEHDFATVALRVVEQAIGERLDGSPLPEKDAGKNPHAVALGKLGGAKGGKARAEKLSKSRKTAIARAAARARWKT